MKKFILITLALMLFAGVFADVIIEGTGTSSQRQPFGPYFGFERSASLYKAAEINTTGTITSLKWYVATSQPTNIPTKIYITTTTATAMTASTWATMTTGLTPVYQGTLAFSATGWYDIDIDNFSYTADNLLVLCETNYGGGGTGSYPYFRYSTATTGTHQYWYQDTTAPTGNGTLNTQRPNITLAGITDTNPPGVCSLVFPTPTGVTGVGITPTLSWAAGGGAPTGYDIYFGETLPAEGSPNAGHAVQTTTTWPTGTLNYSTTYSWKIVPWNTYGHPDYSACPTWTFTTKANPTIINFPTCFDFGTLTTDAFPPLNWTKHSGVLANPTVLGAAGTGSWIQDDWKNVSSSTNKAARINIYGPSTVGWLISPPIAVPDNDYEVLFDVAYMA